MSDHGMVPQRDRWTAEEDATLVRRIGEGASATQIGIELNRSRNAVCGRVHRKKLHPQHNEHRRAARAAVTRRSRTSFSPSDDLVIREMAAAGKSSSEIGDVLGRHKASVVKRARAIGASLDRKGGPKPGAANPLTIKARKTFLHAGNIAGKKESRANDPEFKHVTPVVAVEPLMVKLVDLKDSICRFPIGDPRNEAFGYCGHRKEPGYFAGPYCAAHSRLCFTAPELRRRAA
jgi:GcrA cell cycle regulator